MKKLKTTLFVLSTYITLFAQAPQSINYQAIAWNANNTPITNKTISVTFTIRSLTMEGAIEFTEAHNSSTNDQGLFTLAIGSARPTDFKNIDWSKSPKFLQVFVDGVAAGTTQILSVPYALYAESTNLKAGTGINVNGNTITNTGDTDNTNEIQTLSLSGNQLSLSKNGGSVLLPNSGGSTGTTYSAGTGISISPTNVVSTDLKAGEGIDISGNIISSTGEQSISYQLVQQNQNRIFSSFRNKRVDSWEDAQITDASSTTSITVPETGAYLILASLSVEELNPSDEEFQLRVLREDDRKVVIPESTVCQKPDSATKSANKGSLSTWTIVNLTAGQNIKLQFRMVNYPAPQLTDTPYAYSNAKLALIKLQ